MQIEDVIIITTAIIMVFMAFLISFLILMMINELFRLVFKKTYVPPIDQLRDELLCAICLEICFRPSTTPCGHSFCRKCLRSAIKSCGRKCPKCMHSISNDQRLTVNTVLWNTIQLIFPEEFEATNVFLHAAQSQTKAKNLGTKDRLR